MTIFKQFNSIWFQRLCNLLPKSNSKILSAEAFFIFYLHNKLFKNNYFCSDIVKIVITFYE